MSLFDATVSVIDISLSIPSPEALDQGEPSHVEVGLVCGLMLPITNPQTGGPLTVPAGALRFKLGKNDAEAFFTEGLEAIKKLPEPKPQSDMVIASDLSQVDTAAKNFGKLRGV